MDDLFFFENQTAARHSRQHRAIANTMAGFLNPIIAAIIIVPGSDATAEEIGKYRLQLEFYLFIQDCVEKANTKAADENNFDEQTLDKFLAATFRNLTTKYRSLAQEVFEKWCDMRSSGEGGNEVKEEVVELVEKIDVEHVD